MREKIKCEHLCKLCGKDHRAPSELFENLQWQIEKAGGLHSTSCPDAGHPRYDIRVLHAMSRAVLAYYPDEFKRFNRMKTLQENVEYRIMQEIEEKANKTK